MNVNRVFILGNLTRDPELRTIPSGQSVASFGIATNRQWADPSGQKQQEVEFHNVVAWGKLAEIINQYMKKGNLIFIEGRLKTRSWQTPQGEKRNRTEIIAERMQMGPKGPTAQTNFQDKDDKPAPAPTPDTTPIVEYGDETDVSEIPF